MVITNLTNTTWVFNDTIDIWPLEESSYTFNINFICQYDLTTTCTAINILNNAAFSLSYSGLSGNCFDNTNGWINAGFKTIHIIDGNDVTNNNLLTWLQAHATYTIESIGAFLENITYLSSGYKILRITPNAGYSLPSSVTVTNGTLISYDNSTGVLVIDGYDDTIINCDCNLIIYNKIIHNTSSGTGTYTTRGNIVILTAHPKSGYLFVRWILDGEYTILDDGALTSSKLTIAISSDIEATPYFQKRT